MYFTPIRVVTNDIMLISQIAVACLHNPVLASFFFASDIFDSAFEPGTTVDIGSPAEGVPIDVFVNRGDQVAKGLPVANLDSTLQEISGDLAQLKADNRTEPDSRRAQREVKSA